MMNLAAKLDSVRSHWPCPCRQALPSCTAWIQLLDYEKWHTWFELGGYIAKKRNRGCGLRRCCRNQLAAGAGGVRICARS